MLTDKQKRALLNAYINACKSRSNRRMSQKKILKKRRLRKLKINLKIDSLYERFKKSFLISTITNIHK
jgi:hypothetical protein